MARHPPISLHASGFRHPRSGLMGGPARGEAFTPYADLLHVVAGPRGVRIGMRGGSLLLSRSNLRGTDTALRLVAALRERVGALPDGTDRLARMAALDREVQAPPRRGLMRWLLAICVVAFVLQRLSPSFEATAVFSSDLVAAGEYWRLATANLLHGGIGHLAINGLGLLILGSLLERVVGVAATSLVAGVSAVVAMSASLLAGYPQALGASGIVAGLVGALVWLEVRAPELVAAPYRLPRGLLFVAIGLDLVVLGFLPGIAHWAHLGGFLGGGLAMAAVAPGSDARPVGSPAFRKPWLRVANGGLAAGLVLSLGMAGFLAWSPSGDAVRMRAERLLRLEGVHPLILNNEAWVIAVADDPDPGALAAARALAEQAVARTGRRDPNLLDTLAEVCFQQGEADCAVATIDEAIALAPGEAYFAEQRRRFRGERAAEDRPAPPTETLPDAPVPDLPVGDTPGLRV